LNCADIQKYELAQLKQAHRIFCVAVADAQAKAGDVPLGQCKLSKDSEQIWLHSGASGQLEDFLTCPP